MLTRLFLGSFVSFGPWLLTKKKGILTSDSVHFIFGWNL